MNNESQQNPIALDYEEALINDSHIHLSLFGTGSGKSYVCLKKIANIINTIASKKIYPEKDRFVFATPTKQNIQDGLEKMQRFLSKDLFDKYVVHIKSNKDIFKEYLSDNVTRKHIKDLHEEKEIKINNYIQEYNFYNPRKKLSKEHEKRTQDAVKKSLNLISKCLSQDEINKIITKSFKETSVTYKNLSAFTRLNDPQGFVVAFMTHAKFSQPVFKDLNLNKFSIDNSVIFLDEIDAYYKTLRNKNMDQIPYKLDNMIKCISNRDNNIEISEHIYDELNIFFNGRFKLYKEQHHIHKKIIISESLYEQASMELFKKNNSALIVSLSGNEQYVNAKNIHADTLFLKDQGNYLELVSIGKENKEERKNHIEFKLWLRDSIRIINDFKGVVSQAVYSDENIKKDDKHKEIDRIYADLNCLEIQDFHYKNRPTKDYFTSANNFHEFGVKLAVLERDFKKSIDSKEFAISITLYDCPWSPTKSLEMLTKSTRNNKIVGISATGNLRTPENFDYDYLKGIGLKISQTNRQLLKKESQSRQRNFRDNVSIDYKVIKSRENRNPIEGQKKIKNLFSISEKNLYNLLMDIKDNDPLCYKKNDKEQQSYYWKVNEVDELVDVLDSFVRDNGIYGVGLTNGGMSTKVLNKLKSVYNFLEIFVVKAENFDESKLAIQSLLNENKKVFCFINTKAGGVGVNLNVEIASIHKDKITTVSTQKERIDNTVDPDWLWVQDKTHLVKHNIEENLPPADIFNFVEYSAHLRFLDQIPLPHTTYLKRKFEKKPVLLLKDFEVYGDYYLNLEQSHYLQFIGRQDRTNNKCKDLFFRCGDKVDRFLSTVQLNKHNTSQWTLELQKEAKSKKDYFSDENEELTYQLSQAKEKHLESLNIAKAGNSLNDESIRQHQRIRESLLANITCNEIPQGMNEFYMENKNHILSEESRDLFRVFNSHCLEKKTKNYSIDKVLNVFNDLCENNTTKYFFKESKITVNKNDKYMIDPYSEKLIIGWLAEESFRANFEQCTNLPLDIYEKADFICKLDNKIIAIDIKHYAQSPDEKNSNKLIYSSKDKRKIIEDYYKNKILKKEEDKALEEAKVEANFEISKNKITNTSEQKEIHQKHKNLITELYKKDAIKKLKPVYYLLVDTYYNGSFKDIKETYTIEYSEDKKTKKQKKAYRVFQCSGFLNKSTKEINETLNQYLSNNYAD